MPDLITIGNLQRRNVSGTFSHSNNIDVQELLEFTSLVDVVKLSVDFNAMSNPLTIKTFSKVDGTNYRQASVKVYPNDFDTDTKTAEIILQGKGQDQKITIQSKQLEGQSTSIPYSYVIEELI